MIAKFMSELRRRNVIKTLAIYLGGVWATLEVVGTVLPLLNLAPVIGTAIALVLLAGIPVTIYLSWFFELTPEGLQRTVPDDGPELPLTALHWLGLVAILVGSIGIGVFLFDRISAGLSKAEQGTAYLDLQKSIAVLPFRDLSPDQDQAYFADGVAEELISLLGQNPVLQVAAASSSFALPKTGMDPILAGKKLAVATLLSGSVLVSGNRIKLNVELVNTADGKVLWTQSFSRTMSDVFTVESEIARAIANLLQETYVEAQAIPTLNKTASADAYVLYLKGREQYRKQTTEAMKEARKLFEQALGLDGEYAQAYVGLADSIVLLAKGKSKLGILEPDIASQLAELNLEKALVRAPDLAEAYAIQGKVLELKLQDAAALPMYDKAIELNPSLAIAHMWRYIVLDRLNRKVEAMESLEKAISLDPLSVTLMFNRGFELSRRGRFAEARGQYERLIAQYPESPMGYQGLADAAFQVGELALSLEQWSKAKAASPDNPNFQQAYLAVLLSLGMLDEAKPLATDPFYTSTLLLLSGDYAALRKEMEFQIKSQPDDPWLAFEAGWYEYLVGDPARGTELLASAFPRLDPGELYSPSAVVPMCSPAVELVYALKQRNALSAYEALRDKCAEMLAAARQQGLVSMNLNYLAARLAALNGDSATALDELELAVANGWREWWTGKDPLLSSIREQARAQAAFQSIDAALAAEREKARMLLKVSH